MTEMLEFENQMLLDVITGNNLLIAAKGLSIETVILNLIKVYCDPGNLVLILGATVDEEQHYISQLESMGVNPLPKVISSDNLSGNREELYLSGGVYFISSRILVVDFLKKRLPVPNITGMMVLRAHKILEKAQDAFALRLYRQKNHTGFISAFSRSPQTFSSGLMKLERIMKSLFVNNLILWPRFHATITMSLKEHQPEVIELHIDMTHSMKTIQASVLDCVDFCIKEIKRVNPMIETDEITVENALSKSFYKLLQIRLDPIWNQLSGRTKQLIADLKTLRSILGYLTQSDCIRLYNFLSTLRTKEYTMKSGGWMILDSAEAIFVTAKSRIYDSKQCLKPEHNPKWRTLNEVLLEVQNHDKVSNNHSTVLVLVESPSTVKQLKQVLTMGPDDMLNYWYYRLIGEKSGSKDSKEDNSENDEEDDYLNDVETITLTQKVDSECDGNTTFTECPESEIEEIQDPVIVIQQFKKDQDGLFLPKTLKRLKPTAIVMYDTDISAIRQIEIYQRAFSEKQIKVYFLMYDESVDEQTYLSGLRKEKMAFEKLISEKSTLVIEELLPGEGIQTLSPVKKSTREGGAQPVIVTPRIIVDMREFRSELPSLLHKRGIDIEPVTLQIGDYILTPEMCVERKSVNDLIGSLNSGRLYTQALAMTRHYAKPILLIEFDENKPFGLQGRYFLSNDMSSNDIQSKLLLLTLHFPRLRIVWSPNPFSSAQLFHELKEGKEEPCSTTAASIGVEDAPLEDERLDKYNIGIQDFVAKLPGVNSKNINQLLNKGKSLSHLLTLSKEEIFEILGNKVNSELIYNALHKPVKPNVDGGSTNNFRAKGKGRPFRIRAHP
ncbi:DNA repair endonuclease XPF [Cimex lectularius]|uniref:DNA repair endonuclease XPF n=1 Tax=Cimex lectularius TaxID=79782 RepID=A0A8I6SD90_CIMLE|nr:DNA repair endonuclease XPF [Cimex lectularius]